MGMGCGVNGCRAVLLGVTSHVPFGFELIDLVLEQIHQ